MVVLFHLLAFFFNKSGVGDRTTHYYARLGFAGVMIFFVLSGFVIAYTVRRKIEEQPGYSLRAYLIERATRIGIVLIPAVAVVVLLDALVMRRFYPDLDLRLFPYAFSTLLLLTDFTGFGPGAAPLPPVSGMEPVWSLTYEACLYVLFGAAALFSRGRRGRLAKLVLFAGAFGFLTRFPHAALMSYTWSLGVLAFVLFRRGLIPASRAGAAAVAAAVVAAGAGLLRLAAFLPAGSRDWLFVTLIAALFAALFALFGALEPGPRLRAAAAFFGAYSYSMYLLHYILIDVAVNCLFDVRAVLAGGAPRIALFLAVLFIAVHLLSLGFSLVTERYTGRVRGILLAAAGARRG